MAADYLRLVSILRYGALVALGTAALAGCSAVTDNPSNQNPSVTLVTPTITMATPSVTTKLPPSSKSTEPPMPTKLSADFGDAPDGNPAGYANTRIIGRFPTRLKTRSSNKPGAHIYTPGADRLGPSVTTEPSADDSANPDTAPNLVNSDSADNGVRGLTLTLDGIPASAVIDLTVSLDPSAPVGDRFVNILIDMNLDGRWGPSAGVAPEWAIRNFPVKVDPGATKQIQTDKFPIGSATQLPDGAWMRVLLTRSRIEGNQWDGGGRWPFGEVEDYRIVLPRLSGNTDSQEPMPLVATICPSVITVPSDVLVARATCGLINLGGDGLSRLSLIRASGKMRITPERTENILLRGGSTREIPLAIVSHQRATEWRYRSGQRIPSKITKGTVVIGLQPVDHVLTVTPAAADQPMFRGDASNDYFSISEAHVVKGFPFGDIRRIASGNATLTTTHLEALRSSSFAVVPTNPIDRSERYAAFLVDLDDPIPLDNQQLGIQISVAIQANSDPTDNWTARVAEFDIFQNTDTWFEIHYRPNTNPSWRLQKRTSATPLTVMPTGALAFISKNHVLLLVPAIEIKRPITDLQYRATTFIHESGDPLGNTGPSMTDVSPELDQSLATFATAPPAAG